MHVLYQVSNFSSLRCLHFQINLDVRMMTKYSGFVMDGFRCYFQNHLITPLYAYEGILSAFSEQPDRNDAKWMSKQTFPGYNCLEAMVTTVVDSHLFELFKQPFCWNSEHQFRRNCFVSFDKMSQSGSIHGVLSHNCTFARYSILVSGSRYVSARWVPRICNLIEILDEWMNA